MTLSPPPPIKGLGYQSKIRLMMSANPPSAVLLLPDEGEGDKENCRTAPLALLLDYIMSKFPVASKPLARPSNRLPDNNSSEISGSLGKVPTMVQRLPPSVLRAHNSEDSGIFDLFIQNREGCCIDY